MTELVKQLNPFEVKTYLLKIIENFSAINDLNVL